MNIKEKAAEIRRLQNDEAFQYLLKSIKEDQSNIFLNPHSSIEDRETAHSIVIALSKIEDRIAQIILDEAIFDKRH
jgi:ribosomal protein L22|tara:strand:+ start:5920 stop:6147 length:228 start_codon:yes stop_codon:yes gene_type:complete